MMVTGFGVDPEGTADDGRIEVVEVLPGLIAHHGGDGSAFAVVGVVHQAAGGGLQAEHAEVVAGDELGHGGPRLFLSAVTARCERAVFVAGLHGCQLGEVGIGVSEFVECVGGDGPLSPSLCVPLPTQQALRSPMRTRDLGSETGRSRSRTALTRVKMAAFAPMPRARVRTAVMVKPGCLAQLA